MTPPPAPEHYADWRLLRVYAHYRVFLAVLLLGLFLLTAGRELGKAQPLLFLVSSGSYLLLTLLSQWMTRQPEENIAYTAVLLLMVDVMALGLMMHATGDLTSQFSVLFVVTVAAGNILLSGRLGAFIAAISTITILYEQFYFSLRSGDISTPETLAQASVLGLSFFAAALFSQLISHRVRQSEALAERQAHDIVGLQSLNEQIIQRMRTGIMVVAPNRQLLQVNDASMTLLGLDRQQAWLGRTLKEASAVLEAGLHAWHQNSALRPIPFRNQETSATISASFAAMSPEPDSNVLVFLEDSAQMTQHAQQLKLASLGRLAASIAHEVRNPLGAISHATQLLVESPAISGPDKRLLDIIEQHCRRVNGIIENVLQLSRRQSSTPERLPLKAWLEEFISEFNAARPRYAEIELKSEDDISVRFDPRQLEQVLTNLINNGLRYSLQYSGRETISLCVGRLSLDDLPFLDIIDQGPGIPAPIREHLFEPFYTTENTGTGLGLYLSRELCEANQARLDCLKQDAPGACFRITFAHPNRQS